MPQRKPAPVLLSLAAAGLLGAALAGVLLFLLATASGNTSMFASHYPLLLGMNAALAAAALMAAESFSNFAFTAGYNWYK